SRPRTWRLGSSTGRSRSTAAEESPTIFRWPASTPISAHCDWPMVPTRCTDGRSRGVNCDGGRTHGSPDERRTRPAEPGEMDTGRWRAGDRFAPRDPCGAGAVEPHLPHRRRGGPDVDRPRSEEHTSELQSRFDLVCRLLLEKKKDTTDREVQQSNH